MNLKEHPLDLSKFPERIKKVRTIIQRNLFSICSNTSKSLASSKNQSSSSAKKSSDPYDAKAYAHPDDFYYDNRDDFWDYEDAEEYYNEHKND